MREHLELELPLPLPSLNNMREHPMAKHDRVAMVRRLITAALEAQPVRPFQILGGPGQVLIVRLTRLSPRDLDDDNLASALKSSRDAIAEWLGVDDRQHLRVRYFVYQGRAPKTLIPRTGRQRKDRRFETLRIEAFPIAVRPPLGADLEQLKLNAELAAMLFEAAAGAATEVRSAGDVEQELGRWLGIDLTQPATPTTKEF
jgi:hypothetical protein